MSQAWNEAAPRGNPSDSAPAASGPTLDKYVFLPLLVVYMVAIFFPSISRFPGNDLGIGVSTVIVLVIVLGGLRRVLPSIVREPILLLLVAFFLYLLIPTAIAASTSSFFRLAIMLIYVSLTAVLAGSSFHHAQLGLIWRSVAWAMGISSFLTIIDFQGIVDVPFCNEITYDTKIDGERFEQAGGFFDQRSAMAAIFSIAITGCAILGLSETSLRRKTLHVGAASMATLALFLTHNRSGVFGPILVLAIYVLFSGRLSAGQRLNTVILGVAAAVALVSIAYIVFPEQLDVYIQKLGFLGLADQTWESDSVRWELFVHSLASLGSSPQGHGLTNISLYPGYLISPHNIITQLIWAGGAITLLWLPAFAITTALRLGSLRISRTPRLEGEPGMWLHRDVAIYALLAWLANGMTHQTLSTGTAWILFGLALAITRTDRTITASFTRSAETSESTFLS